MDERRIEVKKMTLAGFLLPITLVALLIPATGCSEDGKKGNASEGTDKAAESKGNAAEDKDPFAAPVIGVAECDKYLKAYACRARLYEEGSKDQAEAWIVLQMRVDEYKALSPEDATAACKEKFASDVELTAEYQPAASHCYEE